MEQPRLKDDPERASIRLHEPDEELSPAAREALQRRSVPEHEAAANEARRLR